MDFPMGLFIPMKLSTRAEFATLLARTMTDTVKADANTAAFTDIGGHWAEQSILYLVQQKIIDTDDYENKLFSPTSQSLV